MNEVPPAIGLYVHLPWCVRKCPYCDFNSHVAPAEIPERAYLNALIEDLDHDLALVGPRTLTSIFFGGGTPSLFSAHAIAGLIDAARSRFQCAADIEITLEANPGTIEHGRFAEYRSAGVNRVSLGAQSFSDLMLKALGRIHGSADIERAVDELTQASLSNFNLDLMYCLPGQSLELAREDVISAMRLQPTHISYYELTLEPGTPFHRRPPVLPDMDLAWEMQLRGQDALMDGGYGQYEVSAYSRTARQCRHNLNYWRFGDYLGIGAGAHGKYSREGCTQVFRTTRHKQPREYLRRNPTERLTEHRRITHADLSFEFFLNALRLREGFTAVQFEAATGMQFQLPVAPIATAVAKGWLNSTGAGTWAPSELGRCFLNDLQALFLPSELATSMRS